MLGPTQGQTLLYDEPITDNQSIILLKDVFIDVCLVMKITFYPIGDDEYCAVFFFTCLYEVMDYSCVVL